MMTQKEIDDDKIKKRKRKDDRHEERNMNLTGTSYPGTTASRYSSKTPLGQRRRKISPHHLQQTAGAASPPSSKDYWNRVGTSKEEAEYTVEVHQPMFAPSHRALSSLTPVAVVRARQRANQKKSFSEAKDRILTTLPADSILPRLVDFDKADQIEESGFLPKRVEGPIDHATTILFGGQQEAGTTATSFLPLTMSVGGVLVQTGKEANEAVRNRRRLINRGEKGGGNDDDEEDDEENGVTTSLGNTRTSSSPLSLNNTTTNGGGEQQPAKKSLASRFSSIAKRIATATTVRTNPDAKAKQQKKAFDKLVTETAAAAAMSSKSRTYVEQDPNIFFVAPIDDETGREDFTLYDPSDDIDAVYQQLAHGVQLSHFEVPIDLAVQYDETGLLVVDS